MAETLPPIGSLLGAGTSKDTPATTQGIIDSLPPDEGALLALLKAHMVPVVGDFVAQTVTGVVAFLLNIGHYNATTVGLILGLIDAYREEGRIVGFGAVAPTPLNPDSLVPFVWRNPQSIEEFVKECRRNGINGDRASLLLDLPRPVWGVPDILKMYQRLTLSEGQAKKALADIGWHPQLTPQLLGLTRELLTPQDIVTAWLREDYSQPVMDRKLQELGYNGEDREEIRKLAFFIPAIPDLVRFAVREAFNPQQVKDLDLDEEFPQDFAKWAKKQGVSEDWAHKFWQAHWELPSPTAAFEMYHRTTFTQSDPSSPELGQVDGKPYYRVISAETLGKLLKAQDYAPKWRGPLTEISFNPLTRVDIRRMFAMGFLDKAGVAKAYTDDGYSPENVEKITNFVEADVTEDYTGKVKNQLLTLFRRGIYSEAQMRAYLRGAKIPEHFIEALIQSEIQLREAEQLEARVKVIKSQFMRGIIDQVTMIARLAALQLENETLENLILLWIEERLASQQRITIRDLKKAQKQGIIDDDKFRQELRERNWQADDIEIMIKIDGEITSEDAPPP